MSPKRPQISVKGATYVRIKAEAEKRGISVTKLMEEMLK